MPFNIFNAPVEILQDELFYRKNITVEKINFIEHVLI